MHEYRRIWEEAVMFEVVNYRQRRSSRKSSTRMASFMFFMAEQPLVGQGLLIIKPSRSHSVGLGRTPVDE